MSNELEYVHVRIKDPSGSFHVVDDQQEIKVFRARPAKLVRTERVTQAISNGVLVEISEKEYNQIVSSVEKTEATNQALKDKENDNLGKAVTALVEDSIALGVIEEKGSKGVFFGTRSLGRNVDTAKLKLVQNAGLRNDLQLAYTKEKAASDLKKEQEARKAEEDAKKKTQGENE